jgi:hypothetical protein
VKLAVVLFALGLVAIALAGCATTFEDRWAPVKPLLESHGGKGDRLDRKEPAMRPVKSSTIRPQFAALKVEDQQP